MVKEGALHGVLTANDVARNLETYMDKEIRDILGYLWTTRYLPEEG